MIHKQPKTSDDENHDTDEKTLIQFKNGVSIKKCRKACIIQYINYNIRTDMELHYHECLMLFLPWRMRKKTSMEVTQHT